ANCRALTVPLRRHGRFNIGRGEETSILRLYGGLNDRIGRTSAPVFGPPRRGDLYRSCADVSQSTAVLEFSAWNTVAEGLEGLVAWHSQLGGQAAGAT